MKTLKPKNTTKERKRLVKELDSLASKKCREEWNGKCAMCGREGTQAHHFFTKRAHGATRYDNRGLVYLCFACHIYKVHGKGETEQIRDAIINRIGQQQFDDLKALANTVKKYGINDLRDLKHQLEGDPHVYRNRANSKNTDHDGRENAQDNY